MSSQAQTFNYEDEPTFVGAALIGAAIAVGSGAYDDQVVAFDIAGVVRHGGEGAMEALAALLRALAAARPSDIGNGTIMNALTAVQWAAMPVSDVFEEWMPPTDALADIVEGALGGDAMLREQTADLLGLITERDLVSEWLGPRGAELVSRAERLDR